MTTTLSFSFWICSALTLVSAILATFVSDVRRAVIALWIAGLGLGGIFLSLESEFLAVTQWIVSTLVVISFIFYAVMFGEFGVSDDRPLKDRIVSALMPVILGIAFGGVIWLGAGALHGFSIVLPSGFTGVIGNQTSEIGRKLTEEHLIALEILGLTLFTVIVGSGIVARPEVKEGQE